MTMPNLDRVELLLRRSKYSSKATLGRLFIKGMLPHWYTLEDTNRDINFDGTLDAPKVWGQTAIPFGTYEVKMQFSSHFQKMMPYLQNVPGFSGVMVHNGNYTKDTKGCILVGTTENHDTENYTIGNSVKALAELIAIIKYAKYITIEISDGSNEPFEG